jgi:hypothetical protein
MNNVNFDDVNFKNTTDYQNFIKENSGTGCLKIRASLGNEALPVEGVSITITKNIGNNKVTFFKGVTDSSGMINGIKLPAPIENPDDEIIPKYALYDLNAKYDSDGLDKNYQIIVYSNICIVQYINIVPSSNLEMRYDNGY